ncbi:hypothetical protein [Methylorubrum sp. POS3]
MVQRYQYHARGKSEYGILHIVSGRIAKLHGCPLADSSRRALC